MTEVLIFIGGFLFAYGVLSIMGMLVHWIKVWVHHWYLITQIRKWRRQLLKVTKKFSSLSPEEKEKFIHKFTQKLKKMSKEWKDEV